MYKRVCSMLIYGAVGTAVLSFTPCSFAQTSAEPREQVTSGSNQLRESMMRGAHAMQAMQPIGDVDKDFAAMMRAHHQQAVDMAKVLVQYGKSAELKAMAEKIIKNQQKEIGEFDQWIANRNRK